MINTVLFTETNSVFGDGFLSLLNDEKEIDLSAVVVRSDGIECDYYLDEAHPEAYSGVLNYNPATR